MADFFRELLSIAVVVFSVSTMLSVGLGHSLQDVFGPMCDSRAVFRALLANFVLMPLLGFGLVRVMQLDPPYETGVMLIATAAGSPFVIKLTVIAGGNLPSRVRAPEGFRCEWSSLTAARCSCGLRVPREER